MMKRTILIIGAMMFLAANSIHAEPIQYAFTGTASGSVDSTVFSNAEVVITASADTDDVVFDGVNIYHVVPASVVITVAGLGSGTMTSEVTVFNFQAFNYSFAGVQQANMDVVIAEGIELEMYDLKTSFGPLPSGYLSVGGSLDIPTTMGTVVFDSSGTFTFQAEIQTVENTDSDNDGVPDANDACDNTPLGDAVDEEGCSIGVVVSSITADIDIRPQTLNKKSRGRWVVAYIEMPSGYDVHNIELSSLHLEETIPASPRFFRIGDYDQDGIPDLMVKFKRRDVIELLTDEDEVPVTVSGTVGAVTFEGTDSIRVVTKHWKKHHTSGKQCGSGHERKRHKHY